MKGLGVNHLKLLLLGLIIVILPLALETYPSGALAETIIYEKGWWTNSRWPGPEVEAGQQATVTVSVYVDPKVVIVYSKAYIEVVSITLLVDGKTLKGPTGNVQVARDFIVPFQVPDAEPGTKVTLQTIVKASLKGRGWMPGMPGPGEDYQEFPVVTTSTSNTGAVWIKGEKKVDPVEKFGVTLTASFPATTQPGKTIAGTVTISSKISLAQFEVLDSKLSIPRLGISKPILPVGTSFTGGISFSVPIDVPGDAEPGTYAWTAQATAEGSDPLLGLSKQETVAVTSSFEVVETLPEDEDEWIEEWVLGMCVVATAAFGSEMHPYVEEMRSFRDRKVVVTFTGSNFMRTFNAWYYSWSPPVADLIRANEVLRHAARLILYPVVASVGAAEKTYSALSFNKELAAASSILIAAAICGVAYVAPLILALAFILRRIRMKKTPKIWRHRRSLLSAFLFAALVLTVVGGVGHSVLLSTVGVTALAVTVTLSASLLTVETLTWARSMVIKQAALGS